MGKMTSFLAATLLTAGFCAGMGTAAVAAGHSNPVDRVSNPEALEFSNVEVSRRDLREPFVRDGVVIAPEIFSTITPGLGQAQVQSTLGEPLRKHNAQGLVWNYNFKFKLPQSQNFMVCQYEVMFDEQQLVRDTVWRRRQCQELAGNQSAAN